MGDHESSDSPNKRYNTRPKSKTSFEAILNKYDDIESEFAPKPSKRGRPPGSGNSAKNQAMSKSQNYIPQFYQNNMQIYQNNMGGYHLQGNIPNIQYQVPTQYPPYNPYKFTQEQMNQQSFNNRMTQPNFGYMYQPNVPQNVPPQAQLMYKSGPYPVSSNIPMQYRPNVSPVMSQMHYETKFIPPIQPRQHPQTQMVQPQPVRGAQLHGQLEQQPKRHPQVPQRPQMINQNYHYGTYSIPKSPIMDKPPVQMNQIDKPTPNASLIPKQPIQIPIMAKPISETQQTEKTKLETAQITDPESEADLIRKRMKFTGEMPPVIMNSQTYGYFLTPPQISEEQLQEPDTNGIQNYFNAVDVILKDISKSSMSKNMDSLMPRITITGSFNLTNLDKFVEFNYLLTPNVYKQVLDYFNSLGESNIEFPVLLSTSYRKSLSKSLSSQSFSTQSDSDKSPSETPNNSQSDSANCYTDQLDSSNEKPNQDSHKVNKDLNKSQDGVLDKPESPKIKLQLSSPKNKPQPGTQKTKSDEFQAYFKSNKIKLTRENNVLPITFESLKELTPQEINQFFGLLDKNICKVIRSEGVHKSIIKSVIISNNDLKSHYQVCYSKDKKSSFALKYQFASFFANDFFDKRVPFFTAVDFEHRDPSFLLHSKLGTKKNTNSFIYYAKVSRSFDAFIYKLYAHVRFELSKLVSELDLNAKNPTHQLSIRCSLSNVPKILNMIHSNN
ncbi:hypothetical protein TpMuguga_02g00284 [Theileria parva strain Muguga]|uniref:Uncharacterized protein n=1 Tax=Theileria parva TaxID=5875 RepID=Q4N5K6_THEPA|nr:uncharacterized protein TpMuguga_02g00284 [Theileria parva strain Muguga]EAN32567.1 hypothetical protein TpMuguga_02g00284 [Theileria parva strain Muguga]|eukprot:XP_764850.1 hypothetical protein [Theileria parva strain Muguga]